MEQKELVRRRRRNKYRMKAKAKRVYPGWKEAYKWADHLAGCSCSMCGNPRNSVWGNKKSRLTKQEKQFLSKQKEDLGEV